MPEMLGRPTGGGALRYPRVGAAGRGARESDGEAYESVGGSRAESLARVCYLPLGERKAFRRSGEGRVKADRRGLRR